MKMFTVAAFLNRNGFHTYFDEQYEDDLTYITITTQPATMIADAVRLRELVLSVGIVIGPVFGNRPCINAWYDPGNETAKLELCGLTDDMLTLNEEKSA